MKISILLIFISAFNLLAEPGYSQSEKISLKLANVNTIENVISEIERTTDYVFIYNEDVISTLNNEVDVEVSNQSIDEILDQLIEGTDLAYSFSSKQVTLYKDENKKIYAEITTSASEVVQQPPGKTITGTIVDEQGVPIIGANIIEKDTNNGTITDIDGNFSLNVDDDAVLRISYIGYLEQEIATENRNTVNVTLLEDTKTLDEVVVVGYGTQKVTTLTGAVSNVKGEKLMASPSVNFSNSIVGRIPGLVAVTRSGEPGSDNSSLRIRGANTLGDNSPLVVVDGIAGRELSRLNSADIESVTVLKDASAAIYGARAANGVILITTKRGKKGTPQVNIRYNEGRSMPTVLPKSIDSSTYLEMLNEILYYEGREPKYSQEEIQNYRDGIDPWKYPNTDWYAETFKSSSTQRSADVSISGGQEKLNYFISVGTKHQDGIYKNSANYYKQNNFRINLDGQLSENIKYGIDVSAREQKRNYPTKSAGVIFEMLRRGKPHMPAYWPNGKVGPDIERGDNPVVITTNQTGYNKIKDTFIEAKANLEINVPWITGLSLSANAAKDWRAENSKSWMTPWYLNTWDGKTYDENDEPVLVEGKKGLQDPELSQGFLEDERITLNALLNYQTSINNKHNIKVLFGTEQIIGNSMNFTALRKYFVSPAIDELFAGGDAEKTNDGSSSESARLNYFGRVNYDILNKYLFEFVWRYDGSYIFPESKRYGFFPGVSLGWVLSEENFWSNLKTTIDYLKIRGSWGQTGNDRINTYQFLSSYGFSTGPRNVYTFNENVENKLLNELRIPNPNVTWEVANQSNIGFDASMFDNRLSFSGEYFYNKRTDILWYRNASIPATSGLTLPRENIGEVSNQGYEFQLSYRNNIREFNYELGFNFNYNKNKILFWDETPGVPEYQQSTGRPMNSELYYNATGIFKDQAHVDSYPHWKGARPGDIIFEDVNGDGVIDGLDMVRNEKTELPTHTGGFNIDLSYKNFYTSLFFQWATGAVRYDYYEMQGEVGNYLQRDVDGRWTEDNTNANKPRIWNRYQEYWRDQPNTYWLQKSDYIRLKNVEIGYVFPEKISRKISLQQAKIYLTGLNVLTFTNIKDFDPETTSPTAYPLNKVFNIGLTLTF